MTDNIRGVHVTPRSTIRLWRLLVALIMPLALIAASCGDDASDDDGETTDSSAEETSDTSASTDDESESAEEADPAEEVTLRFSWWGGDTRHEYTQQLIDLYMEQNPHVTIEPDFTGWGDYWDKLSTTVAGGDTPDVMQHEIRYIREYADNGVLADLSQYLGSTIDTASLDATPLLAGQIGDATYAVPTGVNAYSLVADPTAFDTAGVELPGWTEADDVLKELSGLDSETIGLLGMTLEASRS